MSPEVGSLSPLVIDLVLHQSSYKIKVFKFTWRYHTFIPGMAHSWALLFKRWCCAPVYRLLFWWATRKKILASKRRQVFDQGIKKASAKLMVQSCKKSLQPIKGDRFFLRRQN